MAGPNAKEVFIANHSGIYSNSVTLTPQQPKQSLPAGKITDGVAIVVKSNPGNPPGSQILVDGKKLSVTSYPLLPGDSILYFVKDAGIVQVGVFGAWPFGVTSMTINYTYEIDEETS